MEALRIKASELSLDRPIWVVDGLLHLFYSEVEAFADYHNLISFGLVSDIAITKYYQGAKEIIASRQLS